MIQNCLIAGLTVVALVWGAFEIGSPAGKAMNANFAKLNKALQVNE